MRSKQHAQRRSGNEAGALRGLPVTVTRWNVRSPRDAQRLADATQLVGRAPAGRVVLRLDGLTDPRDQTLELWLNRQLMTCGCVEAGITGTIAAAIVASLSWPDARWTGPVLVDLALRTVAALLATAVVVKLAVIAVARARVRRAMRRLTAPRE